MGDLKSPFGDWIRSERARIIKSMMDYLTINTESPGELDALPWLAKYVESVGGRLQAIDVPDDLQGHWSYSPHASSTIASGRRKSWRAVLATSEVEGATRTMFNAHVDVVPAGPNFRDAYTPKIVDGYIYARGACDTKNNLVMLVEAVRFLKEIGAPLQRTVLLDLPIEEEIGGNGTLAAILESADFDEAICLEPTDLRVYRGHRGCLTFQLSIEGRSVHMGSADTGVDAIQLALESIGSLKSLESQMLTDAASELAFSEWERPLQLNIGIMRGGEWSGTVPEHSEIIGDLGFLPTHSLEDVEHLIEQAVKPGLERAVSSDINFHAGLRNDAYITPEDATVVTDLARSGGQDVVGAWRVSCDARLYAKVAGVPTAIFGSGSLQDAHSPHERLSLEEFERGILILADFLTTPPVRDVLNKSSRTAKLRQNNDA